MFDQGIFKREDLEKIQHFKKIFEPHHLPEEVLISGKYI
jgi:hypothetical protein